MVTESKKVDAPPLPRTTEDPNESTTTLEDRVAQLEKEVKRLNRKAKANVSQDDELRNRVEDILDYLYGTNVRPSLTKRSADEMPARVKPSNVDDDADESNQDK